jgi:hypothetical protein
LRLPCVLGLVSCVLSVYHLAYSTARVSRIAVTLI